MKSTLDKPMKESDQRKSLRTQLKALDKEHASLQKKALEAEEHVLELTANELRDLHARLKRSNQTLSRLFTKPRF